VATNAKGYLPANIVNPQWSSIKNKPAGFADGVDDIGFYAHEFSCGFTLAAGAIKHITIRDLPAYLDYHFTAIPNQAESSTDIYAVHYGTDSSGDPDIVVKVKNSGIDSTGCKIRIVAFRRGMASAGPLSSITVVSSLKARQ
jgi:hypothetical protein